MTVEQETGVQLSCKLPYVKSVCVDTLPDFAVRGNSSSLL